MTGYLVFDIETIVDNDFFNKVASEKQKEKKENDENYFVPPIYHIPIAISCLYTNNDGIVVDIGKNKNYKFISCVIKNQNSESNLINYFFEVMEGIIKFSKRKNIGIKGKNSFIKYPVLVSHNGYNFDLPVINLKAVKYYDNLSEKAKYALKEYLHDFDKWENERPNFTNKNSKFHLDTFSLWNFSLKSICSLFDIEVKNTMEGSKVEDFYKEKKYREIALYCAEDVLALSKVLNKLLIAKGENSIPLPKYLDGECNIVEL